MSFTRTLSAAPLAIAADKGFFQQEGLTVTFAPVQGCDESASAIVAGQVDGGEVSASHPAAASAGLISGGLVSALTLARDTGAIIVPASTWHEIKGGVRRDANGQPLSPIEADCLASARRPWRFMVDSAHGSAKYVLCYWLGASDAPFSPKQIEVQSPASMLAPGQHSFTASAMAEPWRSVSEEAETSQTLATLAHVWRGYPASVFACDRGWAERHPRTLVALTKALIRACHWLDASESNRRETARILAEARWLGVDEAVLAKALAGQDSPVFFRGRATEPRWQEAAWFLAQMVRWGEVAQPSPGAAERTCLPAVHAKAAKQLADEGKLPDDAWGAASDPGWDGSAFLDGQPFQPSS